MQHPIIIKLTKAIVVSYLLLLLFKMAKVIISYLVAIIIQVKVGYLVISSIETRLVKKMRVIMAVLARGFNSN